MNIIYWLVPNLFMEILSCISNFVKYGFCLCELCVFCCKHENSLEYTTRRMHRETKDISSLRHLFKYLWPLFIFFVLFASICLCNAVIMFKLESRVAIPNMENFKFSSIDSNGIEKYLWIAFAVVTLLIVIGVSLILLSCKKFDFN